MSPVSGVNFFLRRHHFTILTMFHIPSLALKMRYVAMFFLYHFGGTQRLFHPFVKLSPEECFKATRPRTAHLNQPHPSVIAPTNWLPTLSWQ